MMDPSEFHSQNRDQKHFLIHCYQRLRQMQQLHWLGFSQFCFSCFSFCFSGNKARDYWEDVFWMFLGWKDGKLGSYVVVLLFLVFSIFQGCSVLLFRVRTMRSSLGVFFPVEPSELARLVSALCSLIFVIIGFLYRGRLVADVEEIIMKSFHMFIYVS